jgi:CTP:molybdopterin cytidylyltransferase MocA
MALLDQLPGDLAACLEDRLHVIYNPHWAQGQAASLHASVRALPPTVEAAIWLPEGDRGGRAVLQRYREEVTAVPADAAMLRDIDSSQDLAGGGL